jgi:uroporphyrinogen decarboxylase
MLSLTSRERVRRALSHQEVDRVPIDLGGTQNSTLCAGAYENFARFLGLDDDATTLSLSFETVRLPEAMLARLPVDTRGIYARPPATGGGRVLDDHTLMDEWGVTYRRPEGSRQYDAISHPLAEATLEDLDRYPWPDSSDPSRYAGLGDIARDLRENTDYAICGSTNDTVIFDRAWLLRGMEQFLTDLLLDPEFALTLMTKVAEVQYRRQESYLKETGPYLDVLVIADDMGTQQRPLIRPALYRKMVKPFHRRYVETIRQHTNAKIHMHTCGAISELVDDYIEVGVDVLNPMQVAAVGMTPASLKQRFAGRMAFWGGIDTQWLLPHGTPEEVRQTVRDTLSVMGHDGGYVLGAVHNVQDDVPPENVWAMLDEATEMGK